MGAHESMEHAEHAEHASGSNKKIALLIAVIALFLALSETLGKGAQTESDTARTSKRRTSGRSSRPRASAAPWWRRPPSMPSSASAPQATTPPRRRCKSRSMAGRRAAARYRSEPETGEGSGATGRTRQASRAVSVTSATAKYHHYEIASALFQIGIVLASATIITGMIVLAWISGLLAVGGIVITAFGLLLTASAALALRD